MKYRQVTLQVPTVSIEFSSYIERCSDYFSNLPEIIKSKCLVLYHSVLDFIRRKSEVNQTDVNYQTKKRFKLPSINYKKLFRNLFIIVIVVLLFVAVSKFSKNVSNNKTTENKIEVKGAMSSTDVNHEFTFPLINSKGEEVSKIKYLVEKAELRDEIITEGKRATAVTGRLFLILILKVTNEFDKPIEINTRDYVRLSVNGNEGELLAPEVHNDPVEVQAISTKYTRVGFIINNSDKDFVLYVGQIKEDKEKVNLDLK